MLNRLTRGIFRLFESGEIGSQVFEFDKKQIDDLRSKLKRVSGVKGFAIFLSSGEIFLREVFSLEENLDFTEYFKVFSEVVCSISKFSLLDQERKKVDNIEDDPSMWGFFYLFDFNFFVAKLDLNFYLIVILDKNVSYGLIKAVLFKKNNKKNKVKDKDKGE